MSIGDDYPSSMRLEINQPCGEPWAPCVSNVTQRMDWLIAVENSEKEEAARWGLAKEYSAWINEAASA